MARRSRLSKPKPKREFTDPTKMNLSNTLAQTLIPVTDSIRDLHTQFGLRPYKLSILRVKWSGGERGRGTPHVHSALAITPTPLVQDLTTMTEVLSPVGLDEVGVVSVSEISGRFTDDELRFLDEDGESPGPDEEVFYEIEYPQPGKRSSVKRRFFLRGAPFYSSGRFQWTIRLEKANEDRSRIGDPR